MRMDRLVAVMALALLIAGCATTAPKPEGAEIVVKDAEPEMVRVTASRIPRTTDAADGRGTFTSYPLYVVDHEELWNTGATSVGEALGHLPFVQIHR